jgi:hypothetical protein
LPGLQDHAFLISFILFMTARGFNALARFFVNQPNPATNRIIGSLFLIGHALHPDQRERE